MIPIPFFLVAEPTHVIDLDGVILRNGDTLEVTYEL